MQHIFCAQVLMQQKKAHHLLDSLIIYPGKCSQPCGLQQNSNNNNNKSYWRKLLKQRKMNLCAATLLSCKKSVRFSSIEAVPGHSKCPVSPCNKMQLLFDACLLISFGSKCTSNRWSRLEICIYCFCVGHFFVQLFHQWPFHSICMQSQLSYSDLDAPHVVRSDQFVCVCVYIQLHLFVFNIQVLASHISFGKPLLHLNSFPRYRQMKFISFEFLFC